MKKNGSNKKIIGIITCVMFMLLFTLNSVYAKPTQYVQEVIGPDFEEINPMVKTAVGSVWSTISMVIQVMALLCIIITGVRYMFASSDKKADIKTGTKYIAIGCALIFVVVPIIQIVVEVFNDITL